MSRKAVWILRLLRQLRLGPASAARTAPTEEDRPASEGRAPASGTTITIPSLQSLPGADAFEPKHLLCFGGLAAAGAIGVLEWPVVAAVGVGTYVAERFARSSRR